jgi:menaquinone-dependent protoporphyrinogen oxidase
MASILIGYATGEGQTAKIAERLRESLRTHGHDAETVDLSKNHDELDIETFDAVLVGASIHIGQHQPEVSAFVERNSTILDTRPSGFFQVSLSAATDDAERKAEAAGYIDAFLEATGWQPDVVGSFGGALRYSEYGFLKRAMMKRIAAGATGDTDTSRDYEYTDWDEVASFASDFQELLQTEDAPPAGE